MNESLYKYMCDLYPVTRDQVLTPYRDLTR